MLADRTFWEKATAVHVYCKQQRSRGERLSRHWHDLMKLDDTGYAEKALGNRVLALSVARHKSMFFREKDRAGNWVDYGVAVSGGLQLVPDGPAYRVLADDYDRMLTDGMLLDDELAPGPLLDSVQHYMNIDAQSLHRNVALGTDMLPINQQAVERIHALVRSQVAGSSGVDIGIFGATR